MGDDFTCDYYDAPGRHSAAPAFSAEDHARLLDEARLLEEEARMIDEARLLEIAELGAYLRNTFDAEDPGMHLDNGGMHLKDMRGDEEGDPTFVELHLSGFEGCVVVASFPPDEGAPSTRMAEAVGRIGPGVLDLVREIRRLRAEVAELMESSSMACETPADDCGCAGCLYAAERYRRGTVS